MDKSINSDHKIGIEHHFRVSAGPGAGKTHWLINHLKQVLHTSSRLGKTRKIACITYTNVAVSTILTRLGTSSDKVEVSTIHSFLYKHIVKPYAEFIAEEYGVDIQRIDGHEETIISNYSFIEELKQITGQQRIRDTYAFVNAIANARWRFNSKNELEIKPNYPMKVDNYSLKNDTYIEYKKMAWRRGVLHHDDVLFFSYHILTNYPFVLDVLRAKFPYFYIDEFQDSNPIQVQILKMIGQNETIVGIIGDKAQSIYGFQGADAEQFSTFKLDGLIDYSMLDNRRSTNQIIDILNLIRADFQQNKFINTDGDLPCILIGSLKHVYTKAKELCDSDLVHTLSYKNIISNAMKKELNMEVSNFNLLQSLAEVDSNKSRLNTLTSCIKATEYAVNNKFKEAIKELEKLFIDRKELSRKKALEALVILVNNHKQYSQMSLYEYHLFVDERIQKNAKVSRGKILEFYMNHTYEHVAVCVNILEDDSLHTTIHKAKGDEFDNVLLILEKEQDLEFIFNPNLTQEQTHRVFYVAMSRAKKRLFISVPSLSNSNRTKFSDLPFVI